MRGHEENAEQMVLTLRQIEVRMAQTKITTETYKEA